MRNFLKIFLLGLPGVLSLLLLPTPELPSEVTMSPNLLKGLMLIQPFLILMLASWLGTKLIATTSLPSILLNHGKPDLSIDLKSIILFLMALILSIAALKFFAPNLKNPDVPIQDTHMLIRILYGGITEEIVMRLGTMTFFVYVCSKLKLAENLAVTLAILFASLLFSIGHLPAAMMTYEINANLYLGIILGNLPLGCFFGWIYYRKCFEFAVGFHIVAGILIGLFARFNSF